MPRIRGWGLRASCFAILLVCISVAPSVAQSSEKTGQFVFVGLRPLAKANGPGDLHKLADAQALRAIAERVLADIAHHPVVGHTNLATTLGNGYIVDWFQCRGRVGCITALLAPLRKLGYRIGVTGDYSVADSTTHIHLFTFSLVDGTVGKTIDFDLSADDVLDPQKWRVALAPLLVARTGIVRIQSDVAGTTCTVDGAECHFEPDGRSLVLEAGDHKVELAKDGYLSESVVVSVDPGSEQESAVALKPAPSKQVAGSPVPIAGGPRGAPTLPAVRALEPPTIDGHLDDPIWQKAFVETNFTQHFPDEAKAPTERTELRVLYDDDAIYVGIRCFDSKPDEIVARLTRRDRDIESDKVQIDISSRNDHATAFHFQVNAANVQVDGLRFNDSDYNPDWDSLWYSATSRDDRGWTAEVKIPLVALRYNGDTTSFGFQVRRVIQRRQEIDEWAYVPRSAKGEVSLYGTLDDLADLHAARLFQLVPYDSRRVTFRNHQAPLNGTTFGGNVGADLKLGLTPALILDGTINPDFGTVEADQVVLNLSNTETYFPEKRPFFLEGTDIFATPFQLFYTRRIGRDPPVVAQGEVSEPPPQGQILGALKMTGILFGRLSIGAIDAVTAREDTTILRIPTGAPVNLLVDPLTNFGVLRLRQEFAANSSIGLFGTAVTRSEPQDAAAPLSTDLCPLPYDILVTYASSVNGRCTNDAYTGGADTVLRTGDGKWGMSAQGVGSVLENGPSRYLPDGTVLGPNQPGFGVYAEAGKYGGENWLGLIHYQGASPHLDLNDAGYLAKQDFHSFDAALTWRTLKPFGPFLDMSWTLNAQTDRTWDFAGKTNTWLYLTGALDFENYWSLSAFIAPYYLPYDLFRETHDDALPQYPSGYFYQLELKTDTRKNLIVDVTSFIHSMLRGLETETDATINIRPVPTLELDLISSFYSVTGFPRWLDTVGNGDGTRTWYFADLDNQTLSTTLRGTYTFTPTLSLQTYVQAFLGSAHYGKVTSFTAAGYRPILPTDKFVNATAPVDLLNPDVQEGTINVNVFLRWEYRPGSALWLVYTRSQDQNLYNPLVEPPALRLAPFENGPSTDVLLVKLTYLWEPLNHSHGLR